MQKHTHIQTKTNDIVKEKDTSSMTLQRPRRLKLNTQNTMTEQQKAIELVRSLQDFEKTFINSHIPATALQSKT